ncbi:hypothetical protein [Endozoicomonas ascidiicola]|uniref:hypothetical protein n=1 Tax=Endozoicomonas ascidiicola TaxID=1698521 RepID=UPI000830A035|nr:hypothetical protein [Endozoicomonas ascidiicola]
MDKLKSRVSNLFWWLKSFALSTERYMRSISTDYFNHFSIDGSVFNELAEHESVSKFVKKNNLPHSLEIFLNNFQKLDQKVTLLNKESTKSVLRLLRSDSTIERSGNTSLNTLANDLQKHKITLKNKTAEEVWQLSDQQLEAFRKSALIKSYQLYLLLQGMSQSITLYRGVDGSGADELEKQATLLCSKSLGLCHAIMKAEMPDNYTDELYTALSITDLKGQVYFCSDTVQPRAGWADTDTAIQ